MQKWIRKLLVVFVSVITLGFVTPTFAYDEQAINDSDSKRDIIESINNLVIQTNHEIKTDDSIMSVQPDYLSNLVRDSQLQSYKKFGPRIKAVIEDEFEEIILPKMEQAILEATLQFNDDQLAFLTITEDPGKGLSEKIFHLRNSKTHEDIIRFHVRRDHPPKQGYWFNFHYHTYHDDFVTHYELGNLYWAKDTPPNWMS